MNYVFAHLIGDYLLQNDWMAAHKKQNPWICAVHVGTYMIPFLWCGLSAWQAMAIACQHFCQDYTQFIAWLMVVKGSAKFGEPPMAPWSIIVTDNIIHILWIAFVVEYLP